MLLFSESPSNEHTVVLYTITTTTYYCYCYCYCDYGLDILSISSLVILLSISLFSVSAALIPLYPLSIGQCSTLVPLRSFTSPLLCALDAGHCSIYKTWTSTPSNDPRTTCSSSFSLILHPLHPGALAPSTCMAWDGCCDMRPTPAGLLKWLSENLADTVASIGVWAIHALLLPLDFPRFPSVS